ncbi:MAG TPA: siderophore biosynthesis protein [Trebonia sp.]
MRLCLIASKPTDSVILGFLPAAARLGLEVVLLTDQPEEHERAQARQLARPGCPRRGDERGAERDTEPAGDGPSARFVGCDVWDARELIGAIGELPASHAIVSNSDHLQTQTALAAAYFGLPGKDWRSAVRAKNKSLMRRRLAEAGIERVAAARIRAGGHPPDGLRYPVVLKPAAGVASEDVVLVAGPEELAGQSARILARRPGETLLAEEYLPGDLHTLETLGDGTRTWVLGGFRTALSPPPYFIEQRLTWAAPAPEAAREHVLGVLGALGVSFGACHTEYVDGSRGPALIEVNDRLIGDHCDFVLSDLLGVDLFDLVLRVHLGESLPAEPPRPWGGTGHAVIDYVVADRSGTLAAVPPAGARPTGAPDVRLSVLPLRAAGDGIIVTHTNRDYLGVISAIGTDATAVEAAVAAARAAESWPIAVARR